MKPNPQSIEIIEAEIVSDVVANQPRLSLFQRLLSKRALDAMMLSGGSLLTIGFAVWLFSIGVFENPIVLATAVGSVNLALIGCGLWMMFATHYKFTGRGILLLSSLLMPLNLWLYDSQGLISVSEGEPLWLAALIVSALYALIARVTRDKLFVYTLVGGVVLTGFLFVASVTGSILLSTLPIATFLIAVGITCVVADNWFLDNEGDFSREKFGKAFFRSGITVVATGLVVLATGQFAAATNSMLNSVYSGFELPGFADVATNKLWALGNLLAVVMTCGWVYFTKRRNVAVSALGVVATIWAAANLLMLLNITITLDVGLVLVAAVVIAGNLARHFVKSLQTNSDSHFIWSSIVSAGLLLLSLLSLFAEFAASGFEFSSIRAIQLAASSAAILTVPGIWTRRQNSGMISLGSAGFALATLVGLSTSVLAIDAVFAWSTALPLALAFGCAASTGRDISNRLATATMATVVTVLGFWILLQPFNWPGMFISLPAVLTIAALAISCMVVSISTGNRIALVGTATMVLCMVAQLLTRFDLFNEYVVTIAITTVGIAMVLTRFAAQRFFKLESVAANRIQHVGNSLVVLGSTGAVLFSGFEMLFGTSLVSHIGLLCVQLIGLGTAAVMTKEVQWRRTFAGMSFITAIVAILIVSALSTITIWQKLEIASMALGAVMTIAGYIGWSREQGERSDAVSFNLITGSLLLIVPLMFGLISDRIFVDAVVGTWRYIHEVGGLLVALLLLGTGIICQVRSTTLSGAALLVTFVISNILLIDFPDQLQQTSVLMMIGGGLFFATAVTLSFYRERLMKLPEKIKEGKGVFQVLKWR